MYRHNPSLLEHGLKTIEVQMRKLIYPSFGSKQIRRAAKMLPYFQMVNPDIIFANYTEHIYPLYYLATTKDNFPPIVSIFHVSVTEKEARRRTASIPDSFEVVAVSKGVLQSFRAAGIVGPGQGRTIYNPAFSANIDELAKFEPDHSWFSDNGPPVILGAGRLVPQKDFLTLIDAFRRIRATRPCRLVILGEGPLRPQLEDRVVELGLHDSISLPGWVEMTRGVPMLDARDLAGHSGDFAFMARANLFVLSSVYEGFGLVLVEALACGCPTVSADCRAGPSEILEDPALLAGVGDPEALAQVMSRALDQRVDKAALRASAERFSGPDRALDSYETLIAETLAERNQLNGNAGIGR